ncbi:hypothetical protein [Priestia megaterium]|uniref:hypothetical protein n=1 Tax=Priestia megaterium TaxID=1404 RepID=UPI003CC636BF
MAHYDSIFHKEHIEDQLKVVEGNQIRIQDELDILKAVGNKDLHTQDLISTAKNSLKNISKRIAHCNKLITEFNNGSRDYVEEWELFNY